MFSKNFPIAPGHKALVDVTDYQKVRIMSLHWSKTGGIIHSLDGGNKKVTLGQIIMNCREHEYVKHKNGDKHDCRKENLLVFTRKRKTHISPVNKPKLTLPSQKMK